MEKLAWINLLYDFYGQLLTPRQQKFVELHYAHDLSLGEIAAQFGISRQAVHDVLKRAEQVLARYEEKLGLVTRFLEQRRCLEEALHLLGEGNAAAQPNIARVREIIRAAMR
ncbi:YlxM family DNA-binding protein [Desulfovirgula thermocuniculi]|uniref:YlxM family DNA-binding protein n=1 Tax=Desulfovirgula thermocuniculi TaxID=348842 RepID=UPI0003FF2FA0|nr:YlxM family DNA-binding protein [Desulfovirgula thermocuniculi]